MPSTAVVDAPTVSTFADTAGDRRREEDVGTGVGVAAAGSDADGVAGRRA
jgi:hypothetical protein